MAAAGHAAVRSRTTLCLHCHTITKGEGLWFLSAVWEEGVLCRTQLPCFPVPVGSADLSFPGSKNKSHTWLPHSRIRKGHPSAVAGLQLLREQDTALTADVSDLQVFTIPECMAPPIPSCSKAPGATCSAASVPTQAQPLTLHKTRRPKAPALLLGLKGWDMQSRNDTAPDRFRTDLGSGLPRPAGTRAADRVAAAQELRVPPFAHTQRSVSLSTCCKAKNVSPIHSDLLSGNVDLSTAKESAEQGWTTS